MREFNSPFGLIFFSRGSSLGAMVKARAIHRENADLSSEGGHFEHEVSREKSITNEAKIGNFP